MRVTTSFAVSLIAAHEVSAFAVGHPSLESHAIAAAADLVIRADPSNQPNGYTPTIGACPQTPPTVRSATGLSSEEVAWLKTRRSNTVQPMIDLLGRLNITGFNASTYINTHANNVTSLPNIAISASGGGYRAMLNGAGLLSAFDSRSDNATAPGHLGGLLQSATYLSGLSGGSWLVGSLYGNNFTRVEDITNQDGSLWDFTNSILEGPNRGIQALTTVEYYDDLYNAVSDKAGENFNVTLTDFWGRALSYQLINATDGGPSYTWSSVATQEFFTNGSVPMPIIIADSRNPGDIAIPDNTTIYEFNPWEMGSWDGTTYAFFPLQYVGTNMSNGNVIDTGRCVTGYDNIGYVYGTSSTLFNQIVLQFNSTVSLPQILENSIQDALNHFGKTNNDIASWKNPFVGIHPDTNPSVNAAELTLVDGGEDGENIPLHPVIQPYREVDVIFAIDSSADTTFFWPNGTSLVATYERSLSALQNKTNFPSIPDQNTFVNLGLNTRPTFFGCNSTNSTLPGSTRPAPLIVYLPNAPYSFNSNVSTYDLSYSDSDRDSIITNGYNVATRGNSSTEMWPTCVGCAILSRSLERTGTAVPAVCNTCMTDYCWNGQVNSTTPANYDPTLMVPAAAAAAAKSAAIDVCAPRMSMVAMAAALAVFAFMA